MRNRIFAALLAIMFITGTMLNSMVSFASDNNADFVETVEVSSSENVETKAEDNKTEETKSTSEGTTSEDSKTEEVASQEENVDDPSEAENEVQAEEVTLEQTSEERLAELLAKDEIDLTDEEKAEKEKQLKEKAEKEEKERLEKERLEKEAAARDHEKNEPFSKRAIVNGYEIRMLAAAGVFPKGSYMSAMIVSDTSKIEETIADALPDSKAIVKVKAFDIKVYDNHGQVIQPNTEFGTVKVTISNIDTSTAMFNDKRDMEVFHMSKDNENAEEVSTSLTMNNVSFNASGFSTYAIVDVTQVTEENKQETIKSLVQSVTVKTNGDEVKKGDKISITYQFVPDLKLNYASTDTTLEGPYIETGKSYILSDNVDLTGFDFPENMSVKFSSGQFKGQEFGTLSYSNKQILFTVTFGKGSSYEDINLATILEIVINKEVTDESITTVLPDGKSYTFKIKDNIKTTPTMKTVGAKGDSDDEVLWTTTITNDKLNAKNYDDGYTFTGKISSNQAYVSGSGKIVIGSNAETVTPADSWRSGDTFTYAFTKEQLDKLGNGDAITITYKTTVDFMDSLSNIGDKKEASVSTTNDASISVDDVKATQGTYAAKKTFDSQWVNKVYDESGSTDGNDTKWTITINTNGMTLKNLTMYDKFSGDATLIIKDSNLSISGAGVTSSDYTVDTTGGTTYSWKATFNKDINGTITIEYVTTIQDYEQYLRENHKTAPTNTAWITYDYVDGNGTSHRDIKGPTVEKKASIVTNAGIDITKVSYDPSTHKITWHVVANKNKQALTNAVITDVIPSNQDYDEVKNANQDWISTSGNTLTMNLGDALKNTIVEFDIITKVKDDNVKDWSLNATNKTDYKQQVELDTDQQQDVKSDVAIATVASEVLKVDTPKYDYSTHIATFTATIDNNEMMMDNIHLITTIKDFELLDGLTIDSTPVTDTYYKYNKDTGALDITVPAVTKEQVGDATTGKRVVSFKAHVNDDKYKDTNNADVSIPVTFTLKTADLDNKNLKQDEAVTLKFNNVILLKDFDFDTSKNLASYKVIINGAKNMLSENLVVEDTLGTSLVLDTSSVKLYVSSINSTTGAISTDSGLVEVSPSRYTVTTKEEGSKTKLVVKMPSDAGDSVYVLKYDAIAQDKKDLNNSVSMYDLVTTTVKKFSSNKTISASLFNDAFAKAAVRLTVTTKTTEDTSDFDSPIIVNVLDSTGKTVTKLKVPINGKATSIGKLKTDGGTYKLVVDESSVPKGYDAPAQETVTPTTSNTNVSQEFSFEKKHIDDLTFVVQDRESKKDITATNTVVDKNNKTATAFKYGEEFTVKEGNPPYGYRGGKSGKFTINNDGTITVTGDDIAIEGKKIILYDDSLAGNEILISKVSSNGVLLKDAKLKITHVSTSTVAYDSIITKGEKLELKLPEGKYKLEEISAPYGYNVASSITFEIDSDGKVLVNDADVNGEIVMVDTDKPSEYLSVDDIFGEIPTSDGDTQLAVFEYTGDDFDPTTATPVVKLYDDSEDNSTPVDTTKLVIKPQTKYFITDVKKLASFDPLKTRFFDVFIEKNNITSDSKTNNNTTTRATTNGGSNATATPKKKISISDGGSTPKEYVLTDNPTGDEVANVLKPEDFFQEIIPKAPVIPSGDYYVYRNNSTEEAARPAAPIATPVVENPVVDLQQDIAQSNNETNQKKLTQTGGFIGALTGYATGIILLLIGIFLYIGGDSKGKKKR